MAETTRTGRPKCSISIRTGGIYTLVFVLGLLVGGFLFTGGAQVEGQI